MARCSILSYFSKKILLLYPLQPPKCARPRRPTSSSEADCRGSSSCVVGGTRSGSRTVQCVQCSYHHDGVQYRPLVVPGGAACCAAAACLLLAAPSYHHHRGLARCWRAGGLLLVVVARACFAPPPRRSAPGPAPSSRAPPPCLVQYHVPLAVPLLQYHLFSTPHQYNTIAMQYIVL